MIFVCSVSLLYDFIYNIDNDSNLYPLIMDENTGDYFDHFYYKSWTRLIPYVFGLFIGQCYVSFKLNK